MKTFVLTALIGLLTFSLSAQNFTFNPSQHIDEEIGSIREDKLNTTKKDTPTSDEDYDEDPFLHALLHNNNDDIRVVKETIASTHRRCVDDKEEAEILYGWE